MGRAIAAIGIADMMVGEVAAAHRHRQRRLGQRLSAWRLFVMSIGYAIVLEWRWRGQTIGKRLLGLRVMDVQGLRLQSAQIALRNLLRVVDIAAAAFTWWAHGQRSSPRRGPAPGRSGRQHRRERASAGLPSARSGADRPGQVQFAAGVPSPGGPPAQPWPAPRRSGYAIQAAWPAATATTPLARLELFEDLAGYFRGLVTVPARRARKA